MGDVLVLHLQLDFPRQGGSQRTDFSLHHHLTIIFFFLSLSHIFIQDFKGSLGKQFPCRFDPTTTTTIRREKDDGVSNHAGSHRRATRTIEEESGDTHAYSTNIPHSLSRNIYCINQLLFYS